MSAIEKALGQGVGKLRQPRAVHHGGGNGADPVVLLGQVKKLREMFFKI